MLSCEYMQFNGGVMIFSVSVCNLTLTKVVNFHLLEYQKFLINTNPYFPIYSLSCNLFPELRPWLFQGLLES